MMDPGYTFTNIPLVCRDNLWGEMTGVYDCLQPYTVVGLSPAATFKMSQSVQIGMIYWYKIYKINIGIQTNLPIGQLLKQFYHIGWVSFSL